MQPRALRSSVTVAPTSSTPRTDARRRAQETGALYLVEDDDLLGTLSHQEERLTEGFGFLLENRACRHDCWLAFERAEP